MPPRHHTLPQAQTDSARAALQSFYCELCSKGYSRNNDYEAHLSSYDHSHRQRARDVKQIVKDPAAIARARKQEQKAEGLISIKLGDAAATAGGGFKKGGFKKTGFKSSAFVPVSAAGPVEVPGQGGEAAAAQPPAKRPKQDVDDHKVLRSELVESDTEDEGYEVYDPRFPTD